MKAAMIPLLGAVLASTSAWGADPKAPGDWTVFTPKLPNTETGCERKSAARGIEARGDFNGDGKPDLVRMEVNPKSKKSRLVAYLDPKRPPVSITQEEEAADAMEYLFVELVKPGKVETWCGKSKECADEPASVTLKHPGFLYGKCESFSSLIYWDAKKKAFTSVTFSD
jgi:hypothetical protein